MKYQFLGESRVDKTDTHSETELLALHYLVDESD